MPYYTAGYCSVLAVGRGLILSLPYNECNNHCSTYHPPNSRVTDGDNGFLCSDQSSPPAGPLPYPCPAPSPAPAPTSALPLPLPWHAPYRASKCCAIAQNCVDFAKMFDIYTQKIKSYTLKTYFLGGRFWCFLTHFFTPNYLTRNPVCARHSISRRSGPLPLPWPAP